MKTLQKTLLATALAAASVAAQAANSCGGHGHDSYYVNGTSMVSVGVGSNIILLPGGLVPGFTSMGQDFYLNADCTFNGNIYAVDSEGNRADVFGLTGTWSYPAESKFIFFALDGDLSAGSNMDPATGWGSLVNGPLSINFFMPLVFGSNITGFEVIPQSLGMKKAVVTPISGNIATAYMKVGGKGVSTLVPSGKRAVQGFYMESNIVSATITPTD